MAEMAMVQGRLQARLDRGEQVHPLTIMRIRAGLTQTELAQAVGRVQPFVGKIESGMTDINNISMETGYKLAQALGCSMEDLVNKSAIKSATLVP